MSETIFTPAAVLDLLLQIDELSEYDIGITETIDGKLQLQVGTSVYEIENENIEEIAVEESIVDTVSDINEETYSDLGVDSDDIQYGHLDENDYVDEENDYVDYQDEYVESGIITELAKTLLVGGMVRLAPKLLK